MNSIKVTSVHVAAAPADEVVLFFSGFPGVFTANEDLAETLSQEWKVDCIHVQLFDVSADVSRFRPIEAILEAADYARSLLRAGKYLRYRVLGHSWGGLVALNLLRLNPTALPEEVVLLSPLTTLPPERLVTEMIRDYLPTYTWLNRTIDLATVAKDLPRFYQEFDPHSFRDAIAEFARKITVLQAARDETISASVTRDFFKGMKLRHYGELDDRHWFSKRAQLREAVLKHAAGPSGHRTGQSGAGLTPPLN